MRPWVWINGLLVDPRTCVLVGKTTITLPAGMNLNDKFTVEIKNIPQQFFFVPDVVA